MMHVICKCDLCEARRNEGCKTAAEINAQMAEASAALDKYRREFCFSLPTFTELLQENTMFEKLIPFDYEEARKDPSRVRWACGKKPEYALFNSPVAVIALVEDGATHNYTGRHFDRLRLVAAPKKAEFVLRELQYSKKLVLNRLDGVAASRNAAADVSCIRDVTFDKASGILTVTYDE